MGNFLTLLNHDGTEISKFQNFYIKETVDGYMFVPFGFSGITINRKGDNVDAGLVFPNNPLSRGWVGNAVEQMWLAKVEVRLLNPDDRSQSELMHSYVGQVSDGGWSETTVNLVLNTIIDAVQGRVPARNLTKNLVGNIPTSTGVRIG